VAGYSNSSNEDVSGHHNNENNFDNFDYWIVKLDGQGIIQWQKSLVLYISTCNFPHLDSL
jgi:hypothetical protein